MKIVTWNVNGIRAVDRKGLFLPMVEALEPDIICLQETKAMQHESPLDLPDYYEYWHSAVKKGYSGTAIFTKEQPIAVLFGLPEPIIKKYRLGTDEYGNPNDEGRVITVEFSKFFVISVYTPNAKPDLSRLSLRHKKWDPAFLEYCKDLEKGNLFRSGGKPVIFCGDLNVAHTFDDLTNPKANIGGHGFTDEERSGIDNIINAGFVDTFRLFTEGNGHYTWWSYFAKARERNVGWRIDYFFASQKLQKKITACTIHPEFLGSDHCPVLLDIDLN